MDENFDNTPNELTGDSERLHAPSWRVTIRGRRLTLTAWAPWLITGGPLANLIPDRQADGTTIADLTVHGEDGDELSVRFYAIGAPVDDVEDLLIGWAGHTGYRRIWLPDRLVTVEPNPEQLGTASVRCPTCRARWRDASPEFWLQVKDSGVFPKWCPMCGCELPQWSVRSKRKTAGRADRSSTSWRPSDDRNHSRPRAR